ncbi:MAG: MBL fold metallo-hydrolase [Myxococcota bacterium]
MTSSVVPLCLGVLLTACASRPSEPSAAAPAEPAVECHEVDTSIAPEILTYEEGGVTIHSFIAPDHSVRTATHIIETDDGLVVIDTQLFRGYAQQFRAFADRLGKPITHVIVSHGHPDHYFGLEYFEDRPTYALAETRLDMKQRHRFHLRMHRETEGECDAVTDAVRFVDHDLTPGPQTIGGVDLVFEQVVDAEDNDQLVVRIPAAKTLILQDLMATDVHGFTAAGMIDRWIERLRPYADATEYTHVLAGHGHPVGNEGIRDMIAYLEASQQIFDEVSTREQFLAAMRETFPDRGGQYLVDLMATMKFEEPES